MSAQESESIVFEAGMEEFSTWILLLNLSGARVYPKESLPPNGDLACLTVLFVTLF